MLEAMACGLVCIGTDVAGINDVIEDGVNGYLAKGTEAADIVETIQKAVQLPYDAITVAAVQKIRSKFSIESVVEQEKEIIVSLKT